MKIDVIGPHGFCAGVSAAIEKALAALKGGRGLYCIHALVHNEIVTADFEARGMKFVETPEDVPEGGRALFSAHGVTPDVRRRAEARGLQVIDATCPFVARVHRQVCAYAAQGLPVVIAGNRKHVEVIGVVGEAEAAGCKKCVVVESAQEVAAVTIPNGAHIGFVSQTTLDAETVARILAALNARYEVATSPAADVCTATRDRQEAVRKYVRANPGAAVLVLGSPTSSNTRRLAAVAEELGARTFRIGTLEEARALDLSGINRLGITAGASTPETFLQEVSALVGSS